MAYRVATFINKTKKLSAGTECLVGIQDIATGFVYGPEQCSLADLQSHIENMLVVFPDKLKDHKEKKESKKNAKDKKETSRKAEVKAALDARPESSEETEENAEDAEPKKEDIEQELPLNDAPSEPANESEETKSEPIAAEECNPEDLF